MLKFNEWIKQGLLPSYFKKARIVPLSKEDTPFPSVGSIHTISILLAITKLLELCLLRKLEMEI
jgi:hypothetical protein